MARQKAAFVPGIKAQQVVRSRAQRPSLPLVSSPEKASEKRATCSPWLMQKKEQLVFGALIVCTRSLQPSMQACSMIRAGLCIN
jgi:hypothetical protein